MVTIDINIKGMGSFILELRKGTYQEGGIALRLVDVTDGTPFATLTVHVPDQHLLLKEGEFYVKTWSENAPVIEALRKSKGLIFINTERNIKMGFDSVAECWKFADQKIIDEINSF